MNRKIVLVIFAVILCVIFTGCKSAGQQGNATNTERAANSVLQTGNIKVSDGQDNKTNIQKNRDTGADSKILVAWFSGTGNTERVANIIIKNTGAESFEITPADPYTDDDLNWRDKKSRINKEHDDPSLRDIALTTTKVPNWDSYDVVFIGYPIWWQDYAWAITRFVSDNDFSGKTVIPFCTSTSSGIGKSAENLAEIAGSGNWLSGVRFGENPSEKEVKDWVSSINY